MQPRPPPGGRQSNSSLYVSGSVSTSGLFVPPVASSSAGSDTPPHPVSARGQGQTSYANQSPASVLSAARQFVAASSGVHSFGVSARFTAVTPTPPLPLAGPRRSPRAAAGATPSFSQAPPANHKVTSSARRPHGSVNARPTLLSDQLSARAIAALAVPNEEDAQFLLHESRSSTYRPAAGYRSGEDEKSTALGVPHAAGLAHSASARSVAPSQIGSVTGGPLSSMHAHHLSQILSLLTSSRVDILGVGLKSECDARLVEQLVRACNAGGGIGADGINLGTSAPANVKPVDILKQLRALHDAERTFDDVRTLARAVRLAHFVPVDVRRPMYEWTMRCRFVKNILRAHAADSDATKRATATDVDLLLEESNVGTRLVPILKELEAAGRQYTDLDRLALGLRAAFTVPLVHRQSLLNEVRTHAEQLFVEGAQVADALTMKHVHDLYERTQVGVYASKHLHAVLRTRRRFDSFDALVVAIGKAASVARDDEQSARGESQKVAAYLAGDVENGVPCPLFASGTPPITISKPTLQRLFAIGGGVHATRRHLQYLESMGHTFTSFESLVQALADAHARCAAEVQAVSDYMRKDGTTLLGVDCTDTISTADVQRLYLDGYAGEDTLMHLKAFARCGQRFADATQMVLALRAAHQGEVARRQAYKDGRYAFGAATSDDFVPPSGLSHAQAAVLAFLASPQCVLFDKAEQDFELTTRDIDQLLAVSGGTDEEEEASTNVDLGPSSKAIRPVVFYLQSLNAAIGTDAAPQNGFQSFAQLSLAVQAVHMQYAEASQVLLQHLSSSECLALAPSVRDQGQLTEPAIRRLMLASDAGLETLACVQDLDRSVASGQSGPATSLAALTESVRDAYTLRHTYTPVERRLGLHVSRDVRRELEAYLHSDEGVDSSAAQECPLILRRLTHAEHHERTSNAPASDRRAHDALITTHAAFVPSTMSRASVAALCNGARRLGPTLLVHVLALLRRNKSYLDVRAIVDDVLALAKKESAAMVHARHVLSAREAPFWRDLRDRSREDRLAAGGPDDEATAVEDHASVLRMLNIDDDAIRRLFRAGGGIRATFDRLDQLSLTHRSFTSVQELIDEVHRITAAARGARGARDDTKSLAVHEVFAVMNTQDLYHLQQASTSTPPTAGRPTLTALPPQTLQCLSLLHARGSRFDSVGELVLAVRRLRDAREERECDAVIRRFQQKQAGVETNTEEAKKSSDENDETALTACTPIPDDVRAALIAFLSSPENLLFADCPLGVSLTRGDLDDLYAIGGGSIVSFLRHIAVALGGRFESMADVKHALAFQVLAHAQSVVEFLVRDARLVAHANQQDRTMAFILEQDKTPVTSSPNAEERAAAAAISRRDLVGIVRDVLFASGGAGPNTLAALQAVLFLPTPHAAGDLAEVTPHRSWVDLADAVRKRVTLEKDPTSDQKAQVISLLQSDEYATLFAADAAAIQIQDADLLALLRIAGGSVSNLRSHLSSLLLARRSFAAAADLRAAVAQLNQEQQGLQVQIWHYLTHPFCSLVDQSVGCTFSEVRDLVVQSECGALCFPYLRALDELAYSYANVAALLVGVRDLHARHRAERALCLQRLFEYLNSPDCTLFAAGRDVQLRRRDLEDLLDACATSDGRAVTMESTNRLIDGRLRVLDANRLQPRFDGLPALVTAARTAARQ